MVWIKTKDTLAKYLSKYKLCAIIILAGIILMYMPNLIRTETRVNNVDINEKASHATQQEALENILSSVKGAGRVKVVLTIHSGEEIIYQEDVDRDQSENEISSRIQTVMVTDSSRNESGLIRQILTPVYKGAIIVCDGADDPVVRYNIVDAVSKATGLGVDKISVLKMK